MLEGNLRGQSRMDNPEKLATTAMQDTRQRQTQQQARHSKLI